MSEKMIYVERVSSRPYLRRRGKSDYKRHTNYKREKVTCAMCEKFPCFSGIENMSSNLAVTCHKFKML